MSYETPELLNPNEAGTRSLIFEQRPSDSPFVEMVMRGVTVEDAIVNRPAEAHWHMVFSKRNGVMHPLVVGPWTASGEVSWTKDAEILWIQFKLGTFFAHRPTRHFVNAETMLPEASSTSFWLKSSAWQFPTYENVDTFVKRLAHEEILVCDPVVSATLEHQQPDISPRTVRHRFLQATGLSRNQIFQFRRAQQAMLLLEQGKSVLDVAFELGYSDQPHLTRFLKQYMGYTPGQIASLST